MLYYDLMVKLASTDMANLFNLTATLERLDRDEEVKMKIISQNPKLDSTANVNDMLVDAYLLHFLKEMDPKMRAKSDLYQKVLAKGQSKADRKEMEVEDMGKLQSMRELMKAKAQVDSQKSEAKINELLGNMVKRRILDKKAQGADMDRLKDSQNEGRR